MLIINRDDTAGFRLDTLTTCSQYAQPCVQQNETLTTRTDYVSKYPSVLQTTSYNFCATKTTPESCIGIVKAPKVHQKNPCQHAVDLELLEENEDLTVLFSDKQIDCIRVDGATDEGPAHEEVQYWWTKRHLMKEKILTLVTARSAGSSYLNRVELQNGCLSRGHANTFIPSTIAGSCTNIETGEVDPLKLKENMNLAIDAYIERVNGCPCGETQIKLFKGKIMCSQIKTEREQLLVYLKGSKVQKRESRRKHPDLFQLFDEVWEIRNRHMIIGLPNQYIFMLKCCYESNCHHPVCKCGVPSEIPLWYSQGPPITHLPLPIIDPLRPWEREDCDECKGVCSGHYLTKLINVTSQEDMADIAVVPSCFLRSKFKESKGEFSNAFGVTCAESALLPVENVLIWLKHLQTVATNRQRGAAKAAVTRKSRKTSKSTDQTFCGTCGCQYADEMDIDFWIGCDNCNLWFCCVCENLCEPPPAGTQYTCVHCLQNRN